MKTVMGPRPPASRSTRRQPRRSQPLTRPELAVLLAYAKLSLNHHLVASRVPDEFLLEGTEVRKVTEGKDLDVFALNVPYSVTEAYDLYRAALRPPRYEMITHENEVFEMEIYLRRRDGTFVAVQARRPRCDHSSSVFVTLSRRE